MKILCDAVDRFCLRHPRFGIPNLMRVVVFITAAVLLLNMFSNSYASAILYFDWGLIKQGEVWRLITWLFIPSGSTFWAVISLFCYYSIGSAVEGYWGSCKFTLFYLTTAVLTVALGLVCQAVFKFAFVSNNFMHNLLFLAFATLYPRAMIRFQFIIPIQAKWLAALYIVLTLYDIFRGGLLHLLLVLPSLLAAWLTYLIFFWDSIRDLLAEFGFQLRHQNSRQTIQFKSAVRQQKKKENTQGYRHKCAVCGRTDTEFPDLEFRYCSRCAGYHCFCQDHIFSHEHFTQ